MTSKQIRKLPAGAYRNALLAVKSAPHGQITIRRRKLVLAVAEQLRKEALHG